jgi:nicotinamide-nucleotide amidase
VLIESAVTYTEDAKHRRVAVKKTTLKKHTAVSREVAEEMVKGIVKESGADVGVAVTGIAGPGGGTDAAPVGTVWLAAAFNGEVKAWRLRVPGDREQVKWRTARTAINAARLTALHGKLPDEVAPWLTLPG